MTRHVMVPMERKHLAQIVPKLRASDLAEIAAVGIPPRRFLLNRWRLSVACMTAFVDGEIAAVGGCEGPLLSSVGEAWLFTTPAVERVPMAFAKEARRWLQGILADKSAVVTGCLASYEKSLRFWSMLGFRVEGEYTVGAGHVFRHLILERS